MADIIDMAILLGMGLEKRLKRLLDDVIEEGRSVQSQGRGDGALPPKKELENRLVEEGVGAVKEIINRIRGEKEKIDREIQGMAERFMERCKVATKDDMEVIEKMAQVAREKVDKLEKRIEELEKMTKGQ